jgi:peptidoglycan hydrolase-like protein with peptidoglycan-binding domain
MLLGQGDSGDAVKTLQRGLNRLGAMLLVDGGFGSETAAAVIDARATLNQPGLPVADDDLQAAVAQLPDLAPPLTAVGVTFIARAEVSGPSAYREKYQTPCWPSAKSGITIGIGYDCQFHTQEQFESDWGTSYLMRPSSSLYLRLESQAPPTRSLVSRMSRYHCGQR